VIGARSVRRRSVAVFIPGIVAVAVRRVKR